MDKKELCARLMTLRSDLMSSVSSTKSLLSILSKSEDDRFEMFRDCYFRDRAPVRVSDTEMIPVSGGGYGDANAQMVRISEDFDEYLSGIHDEIVRRLDRQYDAIEIFSRILQLPMPYSQILYLRYYKNLSAQKTYERLYLSRSTFYRLQNRAVLLLLESINCCSTT